jgi:hypothetical protein
LLLPVALPLPRTPLLLAVLVTLPPLPPVALLLPPVAPLPLVGLVLPVLPPACTPAVDSVLAAVDVLPVPVGDPLADSPPAEPLLPQPLHAAIRIAVALARARRDDKRRV